MGTKVQTNAFWPKHHSVIDLNINATNDSMGLLFNENQSFDLLSSHKCKKDGYLGYDLEKVRQTIIEHESIFKNQLEELHRLYRRQRELTNEFTRRKINKNELMVEKSNLSLCSPIEKDNTKRTWNGPQPSSFPIFPEDKNPKSGESLFNLTLARGDVSPNSCSNFHLTSKDFIQSPHGGMNDNPGSRNDKTVKKNLSDDYADFCSIKSPTFHQSILPQPRNEIVLNFRPRKRTIFGVEISEGSTDPLDVASHGSSKFRQNDLISSIPSSEAVWKKESFPENNGFISFDSSSRIGNTSLQNGNSNADLRDGIASENRFSQNKFLLSDCQSKPENPKGGLPWFLKNQEYSSKGMNKSYFMNLEALQSSSHNFFQRAENLKVNKEMSAPMAAGDVDSRSEKGNNGNEVKKILGFPISYTLQGFKDQESRDSGRKIREDKNVTRNHMSDLRNQIDLNLSLDEEDSPSTPSLPTAIVKIATTEIGLEAPAVIESEEDESPREANARAITEVSCEEESDKAAAEVIISISLSGEKNSVTYNNSEILEASSSNCLEWLAEIISSQCEDPKNVNRVEGNKNGVFDEEEESIPDGMDYFEFMTLKLQETKEEHCCHGPVVVNNRSDTETGPTKFCGRARRGRGRQRRDFQRDVLPSLATLSRYEVTEDLQAFEELYRAEGSSWNLSRRNGRGRKRSREVSTTPTLTREPCPVPMAEPVSRVPGLGSGLEDRNLIGWGKRTRRLPRQRCPNTILSIPVKC